MSVQNLDKIFAPNRIAVFGASNNTSSVGYTVLRNLTSSGFEGVVYPVNPKRESIQGIQAYPDTESLPNVPDLAVICTPATTVPGIIRSCGEAGTRGILIISAGFREVGEEGKKLEAAVLAEQKKFKKGIDRLLTLAHTDRLVLLCAEEDPYHCHRHGLITPALLKSGCQVVHLRHDGQKHTVTEFQDRLF